MPTNGELIVKNIQLEHYTNTLLESKNQDGMYWSTRKEIEVGKGLFMVYRKNYFNPQLQDEMTEKIDIEFTCGEKTYSISKSYKIKKKYHYNAIESMMGI